MIKLFSNHLQQTGIYLGIYTVLIRLYYLFSEPAKFSNPTSGINYINSVFLPFNHNIYLSFIITTILVFISAILINNMVTLHDVVFKNTWLTAYFYVTLNSIFPDQFVVGPVIFVNLFVIFSTNELFKLYKADNPTNSIFYASFLCGFSVLLNLSYIMYFAFVILGLNIFRPFKVKEHFAALFGYSLPLYLGILINYLANGTFLWDHIQFPDYTDFKNALWAIESPLPIVAIMLIFALFRLSRNYWRNPIKSRRMSSLLLILTIISAVLILTGTQNQKQEISLITPAIAVFLAYYYTTETNLGLFKGILNSLFLLATIAFQLRYGFHLF